MTGLISESRKRRYLEERGRHRRRGRTDGPRVPSLDRLAVTGAAAAAASGDAKKNPWGSLAATWHEEWRAQDAPNTPPAPPPSTHSPKSSVRDADSDLNLSFTDSGSDSTDSDDVVEWESRNKRPRMRMYADDVESAAKLKQKLQRRNRARLERRLVGDDNVSRFDSAAMVAESDDEPVVRHVGLKVLCH
jgi:hypothetical protein